MRASQRTLRNCRRRIDRRLDPKRRWYPQAKPMVRGGNLHYERGAKTRGLSCGGSGAFVELAQRTGLADEIDEPLPLLKVHLPYPESNHVLNLAFNALVGGTCLEDLELRRFLHTFVLLPCQLVRTGRKLVYRRLGYNPALGKFFSPFHRIKALRPRPGPLLATG